MASALFGGLAGLLGGIFGGFKANEAGTTIGRAGTAGAQAIGTAGNQAENLTLGATTFGQDIYNQYLQNLSSQLGFGQGLYGSGISGVSNAGQYGNDVIGQGVYNATSGVGNAVNSANGIVGGLYGSQVSNLNPYLQTGSQGNQAYQNILNNPFTLPTAQQVQNTPGYQFQLQQGLQGVQQTLGATGAGASGGELKALTQYGQGVASTYYQNAVQNALNAYNTNLNTAGMGMNVGLQGSSLYNNATQNAAGLMSGNTMAGGMFSGQAAMTGAGEQAQLASGTANTIAGLYGNEANFGLQGSTNLLAGGGQEANFGLTGNYEAGNQNLSGTEAASNMFLQGAYGTAAGQMGQANALMGGMNSLGSGLYSAFGPNGFNLFGGSTGGMGQYGSPGYSGYNPYGFAGGGSPSILNLGGGYGGAPYGYASNGIPYGGWG